MKAGYFFIKKFMKKKWYDRNKFGDNIGVDNGGEMCVDLEIDLMDLFKPETKITNSFYIY